MVMGDRPTNKLAPERVVKQIWWSHSSNKREYFNDDGNNYNLKVKKET